MVASLYSNHFVVVGVGKLGVHVIRGLVALREAVVAVERDAESPFLEEIGELQVPLILGDARQTKTLEKAGVRKARAVLLTTNDDLANLDAAVTARELNPQANVVMKIFDETLGRKVGGTFRLPAISSAQVSAPAFIAAATGHKVYHNFQLGDREVHLTDLTVCPSGRLAGRSVGHVQADREVNIVAHQGSGGVNVNPGPDLVLQAHDTILVIAPMQRLIALNEDNQPAEGRIT